MKLSPAALGAINTPIIRVLLAGALRCTEQTIMRYIKANDIMLTTAAALSVIRVETKLTDAEILVVKATTGGQEGQLDRSKVIS